ncbi:unnamed protein product, partial [Polarella glacialis]
AFPEKEPDFVKPFYCSATSFAVGPGLERQIERAYHPERFRRGAKKQPGEPATEEEMKAMKKAKARAAAASRKDLSGDLKSLRKELNAMAKSTKALQEKSAKTESQIDTQDELAQQRIVKDAEMADFEEQEGGAEDEGGG